ncbi:hypothetical protein COV20_01305 [Candidatus Woesearchaeota archaeon CG10_big_fil_rev_8_21_14_0_10_45_16]|nr:MAG: hypothetical protein COV20_01305 [Candidatus Woesearchaeota archaeon CG10_big_fil_rev_8_21_14_0_10_45_16]
MDLQAKRALARLIEAAEDLKTAKLLSGKLQSRSLFHSQQCVEKAFKAVLSKVIIGEIKSHTVIKLIELKSLPVLSKELQKEFVALKEDAFWAERRWIDTRYEELKPGEKIEVPTYKFTATDAKRGIKAAEKTLSWSIRCVHALFGVDVPEDYKILKNFAKKYLQ